MNRYNMFTECIEIKKRMKLNVNEDNQSIESVRSDPWYAGIIVNLMSSQNGIPIHSAIITPPFWSDMSSDQYVYSNHFDVPSLLVFQHRDKEHSDDLEIKLSGIDPDNENDRGLFARRSLPKGFRIGMWGALGKSTNVSLSKYQPERNIELHLNEPRCSYWFVFHPACFSGFINNRDSYTLGKTNCSMHVNGLALKNVGKFRWKIDLYFVTLHDIPAGTQLLMRYGFHK